jgi:hypothetical protein|tara:strand:+ start:1251 stop:1403 length:153 start_codon:yes stop_codon:yes gene_type:complete
MEKKMLREIANDNQTPKKRDYKLEGELYEKIEDGVETDWDTDGPIPLAEF